jgi:hypothetical protein
MWTNKQIIPDFVVLQSSTIHLKKFSWILELDMFIGPYFEPMKYANPNNPLHQDHIIATYMINIVVNLLKEQNLELKDLIDNCVLLSFWENGKEKLCTKPLISENEISTVKRIKKLLNDNNVTNFIIFKPIAKSPEMLINILREDYQRYNVIPKYITDENCFIDSENKIKLIVYNFAK